MTVNEMILEVWQLIGEPSDIDPTDGTANPGSGDIDNTSSGYTRILRMLNEGQISVATHRQVRGRQFKWRGGVLTAVITLTPSSTTLSAAIAVDDFTATTALTGADDDWNAWLFKVGQETRRVVDSTTAGVLTVGKAFDQVHDNGATVTLIELPQSLPSNLWVIRKVWDFENNKHLSWSPRDVAIIDDHVVGDPTLYWRNILDMYFNGGNFDKTRKYGVEYQRLPLALSTTQESELPDNFHWALVLYAAGWGYWRQQESNERKNLRDEFGQFMRQRQMEPMQETTQQVQSGAVREDY